MQRIEGLFTDKISTGLQRCRKHLWRNSKFKVQNSKRCHVRWLSLSKPPPMEKVEPQRAAALSLNFEI